MSRLHRILQSLVAAAALLTIGSFSAMAGSVTPPDFSGVEDRSEYAEAPWFEGMMLRRNANRLGPKDQFAENSDGLDERREALIDALWKDDPAAFFALTKMPAKGKVAFDLGDFRKVSNQMAPHRGERLRTFRKHPWLSETRPDQVWGCHQWMSLTDASGPPQRGNLHLFFDRATDELVDVWFVEFPAESVQSMIPMPDDSIENDPVLDRDSVAPRTEPDPGFPADFSQFDDSSEYTDRKKVSGVYSRDSIARLGITEWFVEKPAGLDDRVEAIIDAIWKDDEETFLELALSPLTGEGGLVNQDFRDISREFRRYRSDGLRTLRAHPIRAVRDESVEPNVWVRLQWMTLPGSRIRTPARGNLLLIFDKNDYSLSFVRFNPFKNSSRVSALPYPDERLPNDPVRDRAPIEEL